MSERRRRAVSGGLSMMLALLAACSGGGDQPNARPPTRVGFIVVKPTAVPLSVTLAGRTVAYETSEVRPQINGIVRRRLFTEGSYVRAGQPLYQIDASLYRAAVSQAQANLASARASADAALATCPRSERAFSERRRYHKGTRSLEDNLRQMRALRGACRS